MKLCIVLFEKSINLYQVITIQLFRRPLQHTAVFGSMVLFHIYVDHFGNLSI